MSETTTAREWWVTTDWALGGGKRLAGPFPTQYDAIAARNPLEAERGAPDLWVLEASDYRCPAAGTPEGDR